MRMWAQGTLFSLQGPGLQYSVHSVLSIIYRTRAIITRS